ncbi:MAG: hypothetical protein V1698_03415 [bacterium]
MQNINQESNNQIKNPTIANILIFLLMLGGILNILLGIPILLLNLAHGIISLLIGVGQIIIAISLKKQKRWAFYGLIFIVILLIATNIYAGKKDLRMIIPIILDIAMIGYFFNFYKKIKLI